MTFPTEAHPEAPRGAARGAAREAAARVVGLSKTYGSGEAVVRALDDVTVDLYAG